MEHSMDPTTNPFLHVWMANCILYAVIAVFLINKGWKKQSRIKLQMKLKTIGHTMKEAFITQATELRKTISIATAELDRIKNKRSQEEVRETERCLRGNVVSESVSGQSSGIHSVEKLRT